MSAERAAIEAIRRDRRPVNATAILLLEDADADAERILASLSVSGPECRVRRARAWDTFAAAVADEAFDVVIAGGEAPPAEAIAAIDLVRAVRPGVPVIVVRREASADDAVDLLARGAAGYVSVDRLERIGPVVRRAIDEASRDADRRAGEIATRFVIDAGAALATTLAYEESLARVARLAVPRIADVCWIGVAADASAGPPFVVVHGDPRRVDVLRSIDRTIDRAPGAEASARPPIPCPSLAAGVPELIERVDDATLAARARDGRHLRLLRELGLASLVAAPFAHGGRAAGAIVLGSADPARRYGAVHLASAVDLARRAGAAIEHARLYREAIAASRRKDEFLARVAHELRTPLNAMLGWASMLRTRRLDEAARARALETIERNARTEARLIEDLLDVSRMMTGTLRLEAIEVELCTMIADVIEAMRPAADAKAIALSAALDDTAGTVAGDPARLRQVLSELLSNAIRATPRGGRVGVRLTRSGGAIEIVVSDAGRGIRADRLVHLFDGFPRSGAAGHGGLGVGLAIARHLVEAHGGSISAESAGEGQGATFTVRLPALPAEWSDRSPRHERETRETSPISRV